MWDLPGPGLEPMYPALAGGFLTNVPPGKPPTRRFLENVYAFATHGIVPKSEHVLFHKENQLIFGKQKTNRLYFLTMVP